MRHRLTRTCCAMAAAAAAAAMLGLPAAAASTSNANAHPAATTACGSHCADVHFLNPGKQAILGVHSGSGTYNNLVRLLPGSNGAAKEDFSKISVGKVNKLYCKGSVPVHGSVFTARQCRLLTIAGLGTAQTFQLAFNPDDGGPNTLCIGNWNNETPVTGGQLRLVTCGVAADTVLVETCHLPVGKTSGCARAGGTKKLAKLPACSDWLVNGGSDNFSNPVVATSDGTYPSDPTWSTVQVNGGKAVDTQEACVQKGPFTM